MKKQITINELPQQTIVENRKKLHQAVQLAAAFPRHILPPDPTDSSASLSWNHDIGGLESYPYARPEGAVSVALSFQDFSLVIVQGGEASNRMPLEGASVNQGLEWLKNELGKLGIGGDRINLKLPYEIETYDNDQTLRTDSEALEVFSGLYGNAAILLEEVVKKWDKAFEVRCWPHHFDLATLIPVEQDEKGELVKSIGVGLSPGDDGIEEPYIYVNVWPSIDHEELAQHTLEAGAWHGEGWSGAVLRYSEFVRGEQQAIQEQFVAQTMEIIHSKLKN